MALFLLAISPAVAGLVVQFWSASRVWEVDSVSFDVDHPCDFDAPQARTRVLRLGKSEGIGADATTLACAEAPAATIACAAPRTTDGVDRVGSGRAMRSSVRRAVAGKVIVEHEDIAEDGGGCDDGDDESEWEGDDVHDGVKSKCSEDGL